MNKNGTKGRPTQEQVNAAIMLQSPIDAPGERLLTAEELAARLTFTTRTIRTMASAGKLPNALSFGHRKRWRASEVDRWIAAGCPARDTWEAMKAESADMA